jgi:glycosyltransferase involved in cell wall biosynthesis
MKILINGYVGKKITGIGRTLIETIKHMAVLDKNNKFIVYTNYDNDEFYNIEFPKNVEIKKINVTKMSSMKNLLFNTLIFPFLSLKEDADIVYLPNFTFISFSFKPIVSVIHDMIEFKVGDKFSKLRMAYRHMIVPRMAKKSKAIITVSENSKKDIIEICGTDSSKIDVIYDAVSNEFNKIEDKNLRLVQDNYILYVGTVDYPGKNLYNALKAFENYKEDTNSNIKFVICGMPGKGYEVIEELMNQSKYAKDILYKGFVNDEALFNYYSFANLFIFVSYYEGFGMPILEAMKFGIPVITSDRSSLPEVAGDAAIICNPDDINEIKYAIQQILENQNIQRKLKEQGYENLKRFSWDVTAQKTLEVFKKIKEKK